MFIFVANANANANANSSAGMSTHPAQLNFVVKWADAGQSIIMHRFITPQHNSFFTE